jgi:hypothetical protein
MKIEDLIAQIKTDKTHGKGTMPPGIVEALVSLVSRLDGMLPDVETACKVGGALGVKMDLSRDRSSTFAWASVVWPMYDAGRLDDLQTIVLPLLPAGQPFGQSEIDTVHGDALLAEVEGDKKRLRAARKTGRAMLAHNLGVCPSPRWQRAPGEGGGPARRPCTHPR